jgi:hypothetical protein
MHIHFCPDEKKTIYMHGNAAFEQGRFIEVLHRPRTHSFALSLSLLSSGPWEAILIKLRVGWIRNFSIIRQLDFNFHTQEDEPHSFLYLAFKSTFSLLIQIEK